MRLPAARRAPVGAGGARLVRVRARVRLRVTITDVRFSSGFLGTVRILDQLAGRTAGRLEGILLPVEQELDRVCALVRLDAASDRQPNQLAP